MPTLGMNQLTGEESGYVLDTEDPAESELGSVEGFSQLQVQQRVGGGEGLQDDADQQATRGRAKRPVSAVVIVDNAKRSDCSTVHLDNADVCYSGA